LNFTMSRAPLWRWLSLARRGRLRFANYWKPKMRRSEQNFIPADNMKLSLAILFLLAAMLGGCGVAATHCVEQITYSNGNQMRADYWIYADHFLADPDIQEVKRTV